MLNDDSVKLRYFLSRTAMTLKLNKDTLLRLVTYNLEHSKKSCPSLQRTKKHMYEGETVIMSCLHASSEQD